jgi:hypothetical protein
VPSLPYVALGTHTIWGPFMLVMTSLGMKVHLGP